MWIAEHLGYRDPVTGDGGSACCWSRPVGGCARRLQQYIDAGVTEPVLYLTGDETDRSESLAVIREFGAA